MDTISRSALLTAIEMTPVAAVSANVELLAKTHVVNCINNAEAVMDAESGMTLRDAAIGIHQLYIEYINAGFTEEQALELVKTSTTPRS